MPPLPSLQQMGASVRLDARTMRLILPPAPRAARDLVLAICVSLFSLGSGAHAGSACVGDCNGDGTVGINELILAVNIAIGSRAVVDCANVDANGNGVVAINELVGAVNNALNGCAAMEPTPTEVPEATATPTTAPAVGPRIYTFTLAAADDSLFGPTSVENGIPVFELPFGRSFRIVVEAGAGESLRPPGNDTFRVGGPPSFQIQATRPLGNGSTQVCDGDSAVPGGVPGIDPPSFEPSATVENALNDLGCRFVDGAQETIGRGCNEAQACLRFEDGNFGCDSAMASIQFCSQVISAVEEFPAGDTLLSARVMECCAVGGVGPRPGAVRQIIVRVAPPFPG